MSDDKLSNDQKPYGGFASSFESERTFSSISKENQLNWLQESEAVIKELILKLETFKNFREAYNFLARRRQEIAIKLKQRPEGSRADIFGTFRREGDHYRKFVSAGDGEPFWKWQKKQIFDLTYQIIKPLQHIKIFESQPGYLFENKFMTCVKEKVEVEDKAATYYCITIKFPFTEKPLEHISYSHTLSQIEFYDYDLNKRTNLIRIEFAPIDRDNLLGNYTVIDKYFQFLINWIPSEGIENYFINAAKLAFFSAHYLFVKRGNASIIEWLIRGLAYKKGIWLGKFNLNEGISWDFKAILTPDINDYASWFHEKLFDKYIISDNSFSSVEYSFNQPNENMV